ncbi:hypothetical protein CHK_2589 [Christensenella hongkongensis]|uniref:Uncharacterized protein n=1 Tax=Christensenella hongkongensis TaxID=270498 RepID=A0A0M2NCL7_9FIRM|nr:hypothetical protein CHK_2589 [Christensenella hongkongensis]
MNYIAQKHPIIQGYGITKRIIPLIGQTDLRTQHYSYFPHRKISLYRNWIAIVCTLQF